MRLKKEFILHCSGDGSVLVDTSSESRFSGIIRNNETATFIVNLLKKETSLEEIVQALLQEYDVSEEQAREGATRILASLREVGALTE